MNITIEENYTNLIKFLKELDPLLSKIEIEANSKKDLLLAAFTRLIITHVESIHILIKKELSNSAYTLVRPLFDTILRMKYMYYIMEKSDIEKIWISKNWNQKFPNPTKMATSLDNHLNNTFYVDILKDIKNNSHDYTHTGMKQIASMFNDDDSISVCDDRELQLEIMSNTLNLLKTSISIYLSIGINNGNLLKKDVEKLLL